MANEWDVVSSTPADAKNPWSVVSSVPVQPASVRRPPAFSASDLKRVPQSFTAGLLQGLGDIGSTLLAPIDYILPEQYGGRPNRRQEIRNALLNMYQPTETGVSGFARNVGNVLPIVAGTAGLSAPAAAAERGLVSAIATGGLRREAAKLPTRIAGGAIAGGTSAGYVNPEDALTGALIGGALPTVAAPLGLVASSIVKGYNALGPGAAEYRVGQMLREAAGSRLPGIRAAQGASPNQLASIASAEPSTPAYQALLRVGEKADVEGTRFFADEAAREAERAAAARAAGGATQTEARTVRERTKDVLDEITAPMRERDLELAGIGGTRGVALEREVERASAASAAAARDVRRFAATETGQPRLETGASERPDILGKVPERPLSVAERAMDWARNWKPSTGAGRPAGQPIPPTQATYPGELAGRAEQVAEQRAADSLRQGEMRREAEMRLASLKAAGLSPLRPDGVLAGIRKKLSDPNVATNPPLARALTRLDEMLQSWTNDIGIITPEALYAIRKNGVNGVIDDLMPTADVATKKKYAAQIMGELRPLIDDAIEGAGGKGWRDYLRTFESGMNDISRKEVLAKALELYDKSPDDFARLVTGESPEVVESILGPGKYDILKELEGQLGPLDEIVSNIRARATVGLKAEAGVSAATNIIAGSEKTVRIPNFFSPKVTLTNEMLKGLEGKVSAKALDVLAKASRSGKAANEAMMALPPADRNQAIQLIREYITRNPALRTLVKVGRPGAIAGVTNALAPKTNENALME